MTAGRARERWWAVGSAYERFTEIVNNDSGIVTDRSIFISVSAEAVSCGQSLTRAQPTLVALALGDGGTRLASSGVVRLTSFESCTLSGTFDVRFTEADGGDAGRLLGTFEPVYCPR